AVATTELVTDRDMLARTYRPQPEAIRRRDLPAKLKPVLGALGVFALALLLFKSPVVLSQVQYALAKPAPAASSAPVASAIIPAEATLTIPKINVHTPVNYEPSTDETKIQTALETGVVHYGNTALPGQAGNSVIFGHSSNDWWEPGNYKFVFVLLDKLVAGDRFSVDYQSKRYTYEVAESRVVEPTDLSVLAPSAEPTMTLITCTPPGTSWKRLIVTAKQVDPDPSLASQPAANTSKSGANLPGSAPGFWQQIGQAWAGIAHGFSSLFGADNSQPTPTSSPAPGQLPTAK
ncbi:MAG TPA: class D sortase, partial [Candidatus Saccharimonas sp.]|nr:class D sortase [Candidatus Saccharimonas sp.]